MNTSHAVPTRPDALQRQATGNTSTPPAPPAVPQDETDDEEFTIIAKRAPSNFLNGRYTLTIVNLAKVPMASHHQKGQMEECLRWDFQVLGHATTRPLHWYTRQTLTDKRLGELLKAIGWEDLTQIPHGRKATFQRSAVVGSQCQGDIGPNANGYARITRLYPLPAAAQPPTPLAEPTPSPAGNGHAHEESTAADAHAWKAHDARVRNRFLQSG